MSEEIAKLTELPLFGLLSEAERETLNGLFTSLSVRRGERVFRQGDLGASLYVVKTGNVEIVLEDIDGQRMPVSQNGPGSVFGEISLLDGGPRTADAVATTDSVLLMLDRDDLLEFVTKHPPASLALLTVMGQRLRSTNELIRTHTSRNPNEEAEARKSVGATAADWIIGVFGSWPFLGAIVALTVIGIGLTALEAGRFTFAGRDLLALWQGLVLILVALPVVCLLLARNQEAVRDRIKADIDYKFNLKSEIELARLNRKLEEMDERLRSEKVGMELDKAINSPTRPLST